MDSMFLVILITLIAGIGAGLGTGFAGMSAAVVITPLITNFLGIDSYVAVGIALASDVLASLASAIVYGVHKHINLKKSWLLLVCILFSTVVGSIVSNWIPESTLGFFSIFFTAGMGLKFILSPIKKTKNEVAKLESDDRHIRCAIFGSIIGFCCGFVGAGGGIMLLFVLTYILGYDLKTAVGTSVLMMSIIALVGSYSHIVIDSTPNWLVLFLCAGFTLVFAQIGSFIANRAKEKTLNITVGIIIIIISVAVFLVRYIPRFYDFFAKF